MAVDGVASRRATIDRVRSAARRAARYPAALVKPVIGTLVGVDTDAPLAALTFDDGPDPSSTPLVLDMLARHGALATFFVLGERAARHPELVAQIQQGGHALGLHGWQHRSWVLEAGPRRGRATWRRTQIQHTLDVLRSPSALVRPPYGHENVGCHLAARRAGLEVVGWSVAAKDWADDAPDTMAERVLARLGPGSIVLFHDALATATEPRLVERAASIAALEQVLTRAPASLRFVTLPQLLAAGRPRRQLVTWRPTTVPAAAVEG